MKSAKIVLLISLLVFLSLAMLPIDDGNLNECPPAYPGGAGRWVLDLDGSCWYLHTDAEFDVGPDECYACHDGIQAAEW